MNEQLGVRATGAAPWPPPARSPCTSRASSPTTASPRSAAASAGDHSTVIHAINRIGAAMLTDPAMRTAVDNLRARLGVRT